MAKTYKINGYLVDPNGDDLNIYDIIKVIEYNSDLFGKLNVAISPTWQWSDECAENFDCAFEQYEERFNSGAHWITHYYPENPFDVYGECSECGFQQNISDKLNYCPNCGRKMKG